jgi:hypothetical protein
MKKTVIAMAVASALASPAFAASFVNGGFEAGDTSGWTTADTYYRAGVNNTTLTPALVLGSGSVGTHSAVINTGYVDPRVGAALGSTVYSGNHAYRVEDTTNGGYASVISQSVLNYTDANIFFAWKAVLLGAHGVNDAATMKITLHDDTDNVTLISRDYNAASGGGGVDPRFSLLNNNYYTALWQIEQLSIDASLSGHDFTLSVLAADCQPTGHWGYVYLDGFGAQRPTQTPEPASLALLGLGLAGLVASRRRKAA